MEAPAQLKAPSGRTARLKARLLESPFEVDVERARHYTKTWAEMPDASPCMRTARALEATLQNMSINIGEDEILAGARSSKPLGEQLAVERGSFNELFEIVAGSPQAVRDTDISVVGGVSRERVRQLVDLPEEVRSELKYRILPYWRGRDFHSRKLATLREKGLFEGPPLIGPASLRRLLKSMGGVRNALKIISPEAAGGLSVKTVWKNLKTLPTANRALKMFHNTLPDSTFLLLDMQGHVIPGYRRVIETGFEGIADMARKKLEENEGGDGDNGSRRDFLESVIVCARAVCDFSGRYAEAADEMARTAEGPRKAELLEMAGRLRRVPARPAETFMDALQSFWMSQVALSICYGVDNVFSAGRVDQYFYPYYKRDLEAGRITREKALAAIEELMLKGSVSLVFGPNNYTIGGVDRDGRDAVNEVSHLFLEALENIGGMGDGLAVRISAGTPDVFLRRALETHRTTAGVAFYNDDVVIRELTEDGYSLEDARDYSIVGCVEPTSTGNNFTYTAGNAVMMVGVLEMALNRGRRFMTGNRLVGVKTPDPRTFRSFEEVQEAFEKQLSFTVDRLVRMAEEKDRLFAEGYPCPLLSSTIEGCIESGNDITRGGARYNHGHVNAQGLATVADSLAAIRWAVFERGLLTMEELIGHLRNNFKGADSLRHELLRKSPRFGNDDPGSDDLARRVAEVFAREVRKHRTFRGGNYRPSLFSSGTQDLEGLVCGATPDGRLAGEPVSNGISPVNGMETSGVTAVLRSAALAGSPPLSDGTALNLNLSPGVIATGENVEKLSSLIRAYFELGGRHLQFNPVDAETLRDAQANPAKYPDLTVKVSGYSARFVDLCRSLQDDIISRTEFGEI